MHRSERRNLGPHPETTQAERLYIDALYIYRVEDLVDIVSRTEYRIFSLPASVDSNRIDLARKIKAAIAHVPSVKDSTIEISPIKVEGIELYVIKLVS